MTSTTIELAILISDNKNKEDDFLPLMIKIINQYHRIILRPCILVLHERHYENVFRPHFRFVDLGKRTGADVEGQGNGGSELQWPR